MPRLQFKTFTGPDQVRDVPHGRAEISTIDEATVGRSRFEPGWRFDSAARAVR